MSQYHSPFAAEQSGVFGLLSPAGAALFLGSWRKGWADGVQVCDGELFRRIKIAAFYASFRILDS